MDKEYREMTADERLRVINAALNKDGFVELKKIIGEYETMLVKKEILSAHITDENIEPIRDVINKEGLGGFTEYPNGSLQNLKEAQYIISSNPNIKQGSIYSSEHREEAMAENGIGQKEDVSELEQPKARVLEKVSSAPNPWSDAEIVIPGQLKL